MVELLFAMALFSFVLLILTAGVLQLFHIYQAGLGVRDTQQAARFASEEISRNGRNAVAFEVALATAPAGQRRDVICLDQTQAITGTPIAKTIFYTAQDGGVQVLHKATAKVVGCPANMNGVATTSDQKLTGPNVSVLQFASSATNALPSKSLTVDITVASANGLDVDSIDTAAAGGPQCKGGDSARYCSLTNVTTGVSSRVEESQL